MTPLTNHSQIKEGVELKIVGKNKSRDSYDSVFIEEVIRDHNGLAVEVIINKKKNYYFLAKSYFEGRSWAKSIHVIN